MTICTSLSITTLIGMRAFISGHLDLTRDQFQQHYVARLDKAITDGHSFVVGNAIGADEMALRYLSSKGIHSDQVTVYFREAHPRKVDRTHLSIAELKALGYNRICTGYRSYTHRDEAMTKASDYDIAWVRPDHETEALLKAMNRPYHPSRISGTMKNILRRQDVNRLDSGLL